MRTEILFRVVALALLTSPVLATDAVDRLRAHTEHLASDAMRGRGNEGPEMDRAAAYLEAAFADAGLEPAFEDGYRQPIPRALAGSTPVFNVVGVVRADRDTAESVVVTAHYDGLGVGEPDENGDEIYNGALDNAVGTGALIEVARLVSAAPALPRHVVFVATAAEEVGGFGAIQYLEDPVFPVGEIAMNVNIDGFNVFGQVEDVHVMPRLGVDYRAEVVAVAAELGLVDTTPEWVDFLDDKFDASHFLARGVPAVTVWAGDQIRGLTPATAKERRSWVGPRHHQPSDELASEWDWSGAGTHLDLYHRLVERFARIESPRAVLDRSRFGADGPPERLSSWGRGQAVAVVASALRSLYVDPEVGERMAQRLEAVAEEGVFDESMTPSQLAEVVSAELRTVREDVHLIVRPMGPSEYVPRSDEERASSAERWAETQRRRNYGFHRIERLAGNVGLLELREFADVDVGGDVAVGAMNVLATADAVIFDLRENWGGSTTMIQLLASYLFEEQQHLSDIYSRELDRTTQMWTHQRVEGHKLASQPVYVLTSARTVSAAEAFAYHLQSLGRAEVIGETTAGGAHPVTPRRWPDLGLAMWVPSARSTNAVTGANWEGTGVVPDHTVPAEAALATAHRLAFERLVSAAESPEAAARLAWDQEAIRPSWGEVEIPADLEEYAGKYGPRRLDVEAGRLVYQRDGGPRLWLMPLGDDRFAVQGVDDPRIRFERDDAGRPTAVVVYRRSGDEDRTTRSSD